MRDDPPELPLEGRHLLDLGHDEYLEVGRQVDHPAFLVLRLARVEANGPRLKVHLPERERPHLALHPPPERRARSRRPRFLPHIAVAPLLSW